jgi:glycosyltransferase 2 family protein
MNAHRHPKLRLVLRALFYIFILAVAWMLLRAARAVDWSAVGHALASYDGRTLAIALLLTATSYLVYSCYDVAAPMLSAKA